ncbi:MAG: hypothetical protein FE78DRAFT_99764 [Acidomyces sp. 'richmondensis']|nr:MAG: hypothetical protein FE78DRAFT_99764 [Acidomyces sp. 'richmondensis']
MSQALVVVLSTSGQTARSFVDAMVNESRDMSAPLTLLAIKMVADRLILPKASFPTKTVAYSMVSTPDTMNWIRHQNVSKVIICDFGGRGNSFVGLHTAQRPIQRTAGHTHRYRIRSETSHTGQDEADVPTNCAR